MLCGSTARFERRGATAGVACCGALGLPGCLCAAGPLGAVGGGRTNPGCWRRSGRRCGGLRTGRGWLWSRRHCSRQLRFVVLLSLPLQVLLQHPPALAAFRIILHFDDVSINPDPARPHSTARRIHGGDWWAGLGASSHDSGLSRNRDSSRYLGASCCWSRQSPQTLRKWPLLC